MRRALLFCAIFSFVASGRQGGTLPGGLLYPTFATSSLINAAALTSEWGSEIVGLYSPPLSVSEPQSALFAVGSNARVIGANAGYSGTYQNATAIHNAFGGVAYRFGNLSLGFGIKKLDLQSNSSPRFDISWIYFMHETRLGMVGYDITGNRLWGIGLGFGPADRYTLEADVLIPMTFDRSLWSQEYTANLALTSYLGPVGLCFGFHYEKFATADIQKTNLSASAGVLVHLFHKWNIVALGNSRPASISVGIAWNNFASSQEVYRHFQSTRRTSIDKRGR